MAPLALDKQNSRMPQGKGAQGGNDQVGNVE